MSEVKIKNITVIVGGQEFSFSGRSVISEKEYDPATDPDVQGKSLEDAQAENTPIPEVLPPTDTNTGDGPIPTEAAQQPAEAPADPVVPEETAPVEPVPEEPAQTNE